MTNATQPSSIFISLPEMRFTHQEVGFVKMHIQKKYPQPVQLLADLTREFMGAIQRGSQKRLRYSATREIAEGTQRVDVSESLVLTVGEDQNTNAGVAWVSVEKIGAEDRTKFGRDGQQIEGGIKAGIEQLTALRSNLGFYKYARTVGGAYAGLVIDCLIELLEQLGDNGTVQVLDFQCDNQNAVYQLQLAVGHKESRVYYSKFHFDFAG